MIIDPSFYHFNKQVVEQAASFIEAHFPTENVHLKPLSGGRSVSKNFILKVDEKNYLLRLQSGANNERELFIFQEAAKAGVAPKVYFVSPQSSFVLMELLDCGTLTIAQAKNPNNWMRIAHSFNVIHQLPKNPHARQSKVEIFLNVCEGLKGKWDITPELHQVKSTLEWLDAQIKRYGAKSTTIHGDPHPRNLFLPPEGKLLAVDWEDTNWDDPFYDISFFCLLHSYSDEEEKQFLQLYLKDNYSEDQVNRYYLCKKTSLIILALICIDQSYDLAIEQGLKLECNAPLQDWSYYVQKWSETSEHNPQFFYDWGRCALLISKQDR
ncbi:MAG TPA: phosphotransferase [Rhabdochlamydiaceae bacterium]|nr:phosphotransferase [Rhabdochlamydiaceae bacterium]